MPSMRLFHRRVASTDGARSRLKDDVIATSVSSTTTASTVSTEFSDEHREDTERSVLELALSDDEDDDWRNDFLSPGSAISNDLEGRKNKQLSPVPSGDSQEEAASYVPSRVLSDSESQPVTSESGLHAPFNIAAESRQQDWVEPLKPSSPDPVSENSSNLPRSSPDHGRVETRNRHNRHRSMTSVAVYEVLQGSNRPARSLSPTKPPARRRASSMTACVPKSPRSPLSACLSLESLYSTLQLRTQSFGPCDCKVGQTWNLIGNYHFRNREYDKAIEAYEATLKCNRGSTETDHIAAAYSNIGTVCWSTGDINRSVLCMEKALEVRTEAEVLIGRDPGLSLSIASSYHQLGLALSLKQEQSTALGALKLALRIREKVLGRRSADVARTLDAIGKIHIFRGEADEAMLCHQEAYAIKRASGTGEHVPGVIASLMNIATAHVSREDYKEAIFGYLAARSAQTAEMQRAAKEGDPSLLRMLEEAGETSQILVDLYTKTGSFHNAQLAVNESLKLYQQAGLREDHPKMQTLKESVKLLQKATFVT